MKRTKKECDHCFSMISLSNFEKHRASASCKNGGTNRTRAEKHPWSEWKIGDNLFTLPCGYTGTKVACRNKLNHSSVISSTGPAGNLTHFNEENRLLGRPAHNKGKTASREHREKISKAIKKHIALHGPSPCSEETRKLLSEKKKKLYLDHPEKHPNSKLAGNRNKMSYPERVAAEWFEKNNISAEHNKKVGKFFPDFIVGNVIVEIDGERWHSSPEQVERDRNRDMAISSLGYKIHRIPSKQSIEKRLQEIFF